jgi:hypothetical protein
VVFFRTFALRRRYSIALTLRPRSSWSDHVRQLLSLVRHTFGMETASSRASQTSSNFCRQLPSGATRATTSATFKAISGSGVGPRFRPGLTLGVVAGCSDSVTAPPVPLVQAHRETGDDSGSAFLALEISPSNPKNECVVFPNFRPSG